MAGQKRKLAVAAVSDRFLLHVDKKLICYYTVAWDANK